jgi:hypothetical protein
LQITTRQASFLSTSSHLRSLHLSARELAAPLARRSTRARGVLVHKIPVFFRENRAPRGSLQGGLHELECQRSRIGDWCVGLMNHTCLIQRKAILSLGSLSQCYPLSPYRLFAFSAVSRQLAVFGNAISLLKAKKKFQRARRCHQGRPLSFSAFRKRHSSTPLGIILYSNEVLSPADANLCTTTTVDVFPDFPYSCPTTMPIQLQSNSDEWGFPGQ